MTSSLAAAATVLTFVDKESEFDISSLLCLQPVQLAEQWSDVVVPRR